MHNVVANDGRPPAEFRAIARGELAAYDTIAVRDVRVTDVLEADCGFRLVLADDSVLTAEALILATGVRDELPAIDGLDELWGDLAAHCPFCHGHEFSGQRIAILGAEAAAHLSAMLGPIASELLVLTHGANLPDGWSGPAVRDEKVLGLERRDGGVRVRFTEANGYTLSMIELRCGAFEGRIVGTTAYDANGVEQSRNDMATPFRAILSNSFMGTLSREICGAAAGPAQPQ